LIDNIVNGLSEVIEMSSGKILFKEEYRDILKLYSEKGIVNFNSIFKNLNNIMMFYALTFLISKNKKVAEIFTKSAGFREILKEKELIENFTDWDVLFNLDEWVLKNPNIIERLPLICRYAEKYSELLRIFEDIRFKDSKTIDALFSHLESIYNDEDKTKYFQLAIYIFREIVRAGYLYSSDLDKLMMKLFEVKNVPGYIEWMKEDIISEIRKNAAKLDMDLSNYDWKDVLIKAILGFENKYVSHENEFNWVKEILEHLGYSSDAEFLLALSYAINLRFFRKELVFKVPRGFHNRHVIGERSYAWLTGSHLYRDNGEDYVEGAIFALPSELSHTLDVRIVKKRKIINWEVADRLGVLAMLKLRKYLIFNTGSEYIGKAYRWTEEIIRNGKYKNLILEKLRGIISKERFLKIEEMFSKKEYNGILKELTPSEIYYLGIKLSKEKLDVDSIRGVFVKRAGKYLSKKEIDNLVGILALSTNKYLTLKDVVLKPYEEYLSAHEAAERISVDLAIKLVIENEEIPEYLVPYITARAFEYVLENANQESMYDWSGFVDVIKSIDKELIDKWMNELREDGFISNFKRSKEKIELEDIMLLTGEIPVETPKQASKFMKTLESFSVLESENNPMRLVQILKNSLNLMLDSVTGLNEKIVDVVKDIIEMLKHEKSENNELENYRETLSSV